MSVISETKQSLLSELQARVEDKILEPSNAALLSKLITNAESDDEALAIAALGTTYKRTGFHFDKRMEEPRMSDTIKYFKKNEALSFGEAKDGEPIHKLIIGENYDALQNLLIQYRGKVDVIYIDPPYGKDSMGDFADTNYENSISRDNLLSMLYFRLQLAKQLLSDKGVIYCSIDDKNQAYVKCLFDDIFFEKNFIGTLPRVTKKSGKAHSDSIANNHDYVLIYTKNRDSANFIGLKTEDKGFDNVDEFYEKRGPYKLNQTLDYNSLWYNPAMDFPIKVENETFYAGGSSEKFKERHKGIHDAKDWVWRWSQAKFDFGYKNGFVVIKRNRNGVRIYTKTYLYASIEKNADGYYINYSERKTKMSSLALVENEFSNDNAKKGIDTIIGGNTFDFTKPVSLIKRLLSLTDTTESIILDFFAGSGTTGHAVLEMNKDGGKRTFILCQMNEEENKIADEITCKRLKRIMTGKCYDGSRDFKWIEDNEPYGGKLDVYEIAEVSNASATPGQTPFDVIDETLYGIDKFKTAREKIEWVCNNFSQTQMTVNKED
ncbi:MAG: site-specific DNA-methyltransferase [Prevotella sp.]|nr:site-specific DNA-methyltransferase [Prevotella sp.]